MTLAQVPHITAAKTIYLGVGAASPAITAKVKQDYETNKYLFRVGPINAAHQARSLTEWISGHLLAELGLKRIAIIGENAKWVQDLVPILRKGATEAGADVRFVELFDTSTSDFSPLLSKIRNSEAQFLVVILSHASSDVFAKQWYDAREEVAVHRFDVDAAVGDGEARVVPLLGKHVARSVREDHHQELRFGVADL